jgi:hypothetical protein
MVVRPIPVALVLASLIAGLATPCIAQPAAARADRTKRDALQWLDSFSRYQVLFNAEDVKKLRAKVEAMPAEEAAAWWEKSEPQRKVLASPEWGETESWLRKFLDVQAKYSDEDIRYFQSEAAAKAKDSAGSLQQVLDRVTQARRNLIAGSRAAEQTRNAQIAANEAYRQDAAKRREEARRQSSSPSALTFPMTPPAPAKPVRYNDPLIDSLDVARWTVLREIFPRW